MRERAVHHDVTRLPGGDTARNRTPRTGRTILLIDDNAAYLSSTHRIIERDGHDVLAVGGGVEGLRLLRSRPIDLVLVDFSMHGMTGEEFVTELRTFNRHVQVVLQTGHGGEQPPPELLRRLDIQGYYDKSEGPDKLRLWVDVGLKAARAIQLLEVSRRGLSYILAATPELHKIQPLDDLLQGILLQTAGLLGAVDSFVAIVSTPAPRSEDGFLALMQDGGELRIRAATGHFEGAVRVEDSVDQASLSVLRAALASRTPTVIDSGTVVPLRVGEMTLGALYIDRTALSERDIELIEIFANQAAVAIHNIALYQMAALEPLTGVYTRRFFEQAFARELRAAHRARTPLSFLIVDLDDMKRVNDTGGHLTGDRALAATGKLLRQATRATDAVGRFGGDEFAVLLPMTNALGAEIVARRILHAFDKLEVDSSSGSMRISGSVGLATLMPEQAGRGTRLLPQAFFDKAAEIVIRAADDALYAMKHTRDRACRASPASWPLTSPGGGQP